jgi:capsular polysaccharide biosynthesis protein
VDDSQPLVTPDGEPPFEDEPADAPQDGQRPALTAVPRSPAPAPEGGDDPDEGDGERSSDTSAERADPAPGVSATFREIERRATAEIHRLAAESRREIAALRKEFAPPTAVADEAADAGGPVIRSRFRPGGGWGLRRPAEPSPVDGSIPRHPARRGYGLAHAQLEDPLIGDLWRARSPRRPRPVPLVLVALALVLLSVGSAYVYGVLRQPALYGAQATFLLTPQPELSDTAVDYQTETQLLVVTSTQVLQPVASSSGVPLATLQREVSADMAGRSYVLVITVADGDRQRAVSLADRVARQYAAVAPTLTGASAATRPIQVKALTSAAGIAEPLEPRPVRILAAGLLVGILAAVVAVVLLRRPWRTGRQQPYWT